RPARRKILTAPGREGIASHGHRRPVRRAYGELDRVHSQPAAADCHGARRIRAIGRVHNGHGIVLDRQKTILGSGYGSHNGPPTADYLDVAILRTLARHNNQNHGGVYSLPSPRISSRIANVWSYSGISFVRPAPALLFLYEASYFRDAVPFCEP